MHKNIFLIYRKIHIIIISCDVVFINLSIGVKTKGLYGSLVLFISFT